MSAQVDNLMATFSTCRNILAPLHYTQKLWQMENFRKNIHSFISYLMSHFVNITGSLVKTQHVSGEPVEPFICLRCYFCFYTEKHKDMLHCKLREFCKEASILNRCGTKNKCSVLFPNVNDKRLKNYCKIDALHTPSFASVTSLFWFLGKKK